MVDVFYHIELDDEGVPLLNKGFGTKWDGPADRFVCTSGRNRWESFSPRGFSLYTAIFRGFRDIRFRLKAKETHYPVEEKGSFTCSDPILNSVWKISKRTLKSTMLDAHVDNPWREQVQWLADGVLAGLGALSTFGCGDLLKRGLLEWGHKTLPSGILNGGAPMEDNYYGFIDYTLHWIRGVWLCYLYMGDIDFLKQCQKTIITILDSYSKEITGEGLYIPPEGHIYFVDWTDMSRRHYAFTLNALLLEACENAVLIFKESGDLKQAEINIKRLKSLKKALEKGFWSQPSNCWREHLAPNAEVSKANEDRIQPEFTQGWTDDPDNFKSKGIGSMQGNTIALSLRLGNDRQQEGAFEYMKKSFARTDDEINYFTPLWIEKVFSSLFESGHSRDAIFHMKDIFGRWINKNVTTWPETFGDLGKICNIFSGVGSSQETATCINNILHRYILGIYPCKAGFKEFVFKPFLGDLEYAGGIVPTPHGGIEVDCKREGEKITGTIKVPDNLIGSAPECIIVF